MLSNCFYDFAGLPFWQVGLVSMQFAPIDFAKSSISFESVNMKAFWALKILSAYRLRARSATSPPRCSGRAALKRVRRRTHTAPAVSY